MTGLSKKRCVPCEAGTSPLTLDKIQQYLNDLPEWELKDQGQAIVRYFHFNNYFQTMAFVNAIAWLSHRENHHPDLEVNYKSCRARYTTHAIGGLSENDFICAAKVDALLEA